MLHNTQILYKKRAYLELKVIINRMQALELYSL